LLVVAYEIPAYFSVVVEALPPKDRAFSGVPHPAKESLATFNGVVVV